MPATTPAPRSIPAHLAGAVARAGIDASRTDGAPREALRAAIASRHVTCDWAVAQSGWVVTLHFPEERTFGGGTLEEGLARCLAWLIDAVSATTSDARLLGVPAGSALLRPAPRVDRRWPAGRGER